MSIAPNRKIEASPVSDADIKLNDCLELVGVSSANESDSQQPL